MAATKTVSKSPKTASTEAPVTKKQLTDEELAIPDPTTIFLLFIIPHLLAAALSPIQDCDEVFNYWEATHYLNHGYGFQTWEYSPVYAIRSWAYAGLHAIVIAPFIATTSVLGGKVAEFYALRIVLAIVCASCETRLFQVISKAANPRIAELFMLIMIPSSGMFHAATAYLPSSFAMYATMLGVAEFLDWQESDHVSRGVLWFAIGTSLGWPFVGVLVIPFVAIEAGYAFRDARALQFLGHIFASGLECLGFAVSQIGIDSYFYGKWMCVPLNIVLYNVFAGASRGPDIYGTEPWHFYIRNLLLNFNIFLGFGLAAPPLIILDKWISSRPATSLPLVRLLNLTGAFYLWLIIFTSQPHKEERFLYPAYPLLAMNAAISLHIILQRLNYASPKLSIKLASPPSFSVMLLASVVSLGVVLSILRTAGLVTGYSAPLRVYHPLKTIAQAGDTVCLGKEWYRYPSSYFLPDGVEGKFIKSSFDGLLPGEFAQSQSNSSKYAGTRIVPTGMNDENKEDLSKYVELSQCTFLVDSHMPSSSASELEPNYIDDKQTWREVTCEKFLDAGSTSAIGRILWTPNLDILPTAFKRRWGRYCLLQRKTI